MSSRSSFKLILILIVPKWSYEEDLAGISEEFIAQLNENEDGTYNLGIDYPTVHVVMENCSVEATRKALWTAYNNRAYPVNIAVLEKVIEFRHRLAEALGYENYAELDIDDQMAEDPVIVKNFLEDLITRDCNKKLMMNMRTYLKICPVTSRWRMVNSNRGILNILKHIIRRNIFQLTNKQLPNISLWKIRYQELLDIYEQFLGITFEQIPLPR